MTIHYTQTVDDYIALEYRKTTGSLLVQRVTLLSSASLGMVASDIFSKHCTLPLLDNLPWLSWLLLSLIFAVTWHVANKYFAWYVTRSTYRSCVKRQGDTHLTMTADGLVQRRDSQEHKTNWDKVGAVTADGAHTFIDTVDSFTYVIPHSRLSPDVYAAFMQEMARQVEAHTLAAPIPVPTAAIYDQMTVIPPEASSKLPALRRR